ncbi:MAG: hypothetical protein MI810_02070 [Flavobacteriales bacterium]|nr:hypothetical protein [Flavobacteriales bacterium]
MRKEIDLDISEFVGIEITELTSNRILFDKAVLDVFCSWRIYKDVVLMNPSALLYEGENGEIAKDIVQKKIIGRKIKSIQIFEFPADIHIQLDRGMTLEIFADNPAFESWNLTYEGVDGRHIVSTIGGEVDWFLKEGEE